MVTKIYLIAKLGNVISIVYNNVKKYSKVSKEGVEIKTTSNISFFKLNYFSF